MIACRATFHERHMRQTTHVVDISSGINIVQSIQYNVKMPKKMNIKLSVFDIRMMCRNGHTVRAIVLLNRVSGNLHKRVRRVKAAN